MINPRKLLAHRGCWSNKNQQNSFAAFQKALNNGYGIETDFREFDQKIYVSHDCIVEKNLRSLMTLEQFLELVSYYDKPKIACNIKSDGLIEELKKTFNCVKINTTNFTFFDMSIPQHYLYSQTDFNTWSRLSEFEKITNNHFNALGYWLDGFLSDQIIINHLNHIDDEKLELVVVSSELHGRNPTGLWSFLREEKFYEREGFYLCTDLPDEATTYFGEIA